LLSPPRQQIPTVDHMKTVKIMPDVAVTISTNQTGWR
jgi:hypothetical protein